MFDINLFSEILKTIAVTYDSISEFAEKSEVNRTYLSKYMNKKLSAPPTPKILEKIANASNGIATYKYLMSVCNYIDVDLNNISGKSIKLFSNPYIDKINCSSAEEYIFDILYTYDILDTTNYTEIEKKKIIDSYNYIDNDKEYKQYIKKYKKLKKEYPKAINYYDPLGLAQIGFSMDNYAPPTDAQREQIKGLLEVILKDNKKDKSDK